MMKKELLKSRLNIIGLGLIIFVVIRYFVPGIGRLLISSIGTRDFPVVQAIVVLIAAWIVIVNFAADIINQVVDPRMRNR